MGGLKMNLVKVPGKNNKDRVLMYAVSACAWCKMTKFLKDNGVEYEYVDVDLADQEVRKEIRGDILKRGGEPNHPNMIGDEKILITGFRKDKIKQSLEVLCY